MVPEQPPDTEVVVWICKWQEGFLKRKCPALASTANLLHFGSLGFLSAIVTTKDLPIYVLYWKDRDRVLHKGLHKQRVELTFSIGLLTRAHFKVEFTSIPGCLPAEANTCSVFSQFLHFLLYGSAWASITEVLNPAIHLVWYTCAVHNNFDG